MIVRLLLILSVTFLAVQSFAQLTLNYKKQLPISWDPVPGATSYDIQIKDVTSGETIINVEKLTELKYTAPLSPGKYELRTRSRDRRNVPGEWAQAIPFPVEVEAITIKSPKVDEKIMGTDLDEQNVTFEWDHVGGAQYYEVEVFDDQKSVGKGNSKELKVNIKLAVARPYTWKVTAYAPAGLENKSAEGKFVLWGPKLTKPAFATIENPNWIRQVKWSNPERANKISYELHRYNPKTKKYDVKITDYNGAPDVTSLEIPTKDTVAYTGGFYQIKVWATGELRPNSDVAVTRFTLRSGDRSLAAQERAETREAIDRVKGFYFIASYLVTIMNYKGSNDIGTNIEVNAIGGTGRLGLGYLSKVPVWGMLGIIDYSGFTIESKTHNFASVELSGIYRKIHSYRWESRHYLGVFMKEVPELQAVGRNYSDTGAVGTSGLHYGAEVWYAKSAKWGIQGNAHLYYSNKATKIPENASGKSTEIIPTLSYQLGGLGSYRYRPNITALAGLVYRKDEASYHVEGQNYDNRMSVAGVYINFFLEYQL